MITVQAVLYSRANKDGKFPLAIRITENRKASYVFLGTALHKNEWDATQRKVKKSYPNSVQLNALIAKRLAEYNKENITLELEDKDPSTKSIRANVMKRKIQFSFFDEAKIYVNNLKSSGKYNRLSAENPRIERFKEFTGGQIQFREITVSLLRQYSSYLKEMRNISERTIVNHLVVIRSIFNQSIKSGTVDPKYYPFGKDKVPIRFPDSVKIGLNKEEVIAIEKLDLTEQKNAHHAKNIWLFSFYLAGMRVSDVLRLRWSDFQDDRLFYKMGKNEKAGSLKLSDKAYKILNEYMPDQKGTDDLVFPDLKRFTDKMDDNFFIEKQINNIDKRLNEQLRVVAKSAGITKKLTMHIARHTFGNLSGDTIPIQMLQKLYRHTSITTTIGYQSNFIFKDTDDALSKVLDF